MAPANIAEAMTTCRLCKEPETIPQRDRALRHHYLSRETHPETVGTMSTDNEVNQRQPRDVTQNNNICSNWSRA
ncbi:hypothetical protein KQ310_09840 [Synechococcus sp. CS-1328]|nr:hypothetical protein [Synechococcus sp. CS-1328]